MYLVEPTPGMHVTPTLKLVRPLGSGGMGAVWLAEHLALNTQVAVKFVAADLVWSSDALSRFSREAAAASQVKSPHVVQMLDHGMSDAGIPYIVMELLEGHNLSDHMTSAGLPTREVVPIVLQLCRALARAHERGVVHRDIKPSNVFLCELGDGEVFVKLLDFGVAKRESAGIAAGDTLTGALVGTPFYMSPEQLMGDKAVDFRSDLWSVGVLTFEALTGERPFIGETVGALTMRVHASGRPRLTQKNPSLPAAVDAWFERACARDPAARFSGARQMAEALAAALDQDVALGSAWAPSRDSARSEISVSPSASTGSALTTGSGTTSGSRPQRSGTNVKTSPSWRPIAFVGFAALGVGIVGSRVLGPAPGAGREIPSAATSPSPPRVPVELTRPAASTSVVAPEPPLDASLPVAQPAARSILTVKRTAPPPTATARAATIASAPAQGSDDDIR